MSIIGATFVDLIDVYKMQDGKGNIVPVIEMVNEMSPILEDAIAVECNRGTRHLHAIRSGLPSVAWGKLYAGIVQSKSGRVQVEDTTGFVEALSSVDTRLLDLSGNPAALRLSEAKSFIEAMNQEVGSKMFYGNTASDPEEFMGLAPRFNDLSAPNGNQIINAGGTGSDNTSIWFVTWGDNQTHLLYPKGTTAGLSREDKGEQRVLDDSGNPYFVKEELFRWHIGLAVKDWRYISRVANIDISKVQDGTTNLYTFLRKAYYKLWNRRVAGGKIAMYCNRDILEALDALATNQGSTDNFVRLKHTEIQGQEILTYRGIPIRETDALLNDESVVS